MCVRVCVCVSITLTSTTCRVSNKEQKVFVLRVVGSQMEPRFAAGALKREALIFI